MEMKEKVSSRDRQKEIQGKELKVRVGKIGKSIGMRKTK